LGVLGGSGRLWFRPPYLVVLTNSLMCIVPYYEFDVKLILFSVTGIDTDCQIGAKAQRHKGRLRHGLTQDLHGLARKRINHRINLARRSRNQTVMGFAL